MEVECDSMTNDTKKRGSHHLPNLSILPEGQDRAVVALIGGKQARTYPESADRAGMSLGTLYIRLHRVRQGHPNLYAAISKVRKAQLAKRHREAVARAREHTRQYFRRTRKSERYLLGRY